MRLNKYLALYTSLSRRAADEAVEKGRARINQNIASPTTRVNTGDVVYLDNNTVQEQEHQSLVLLVHKPVGYICSKNGQGSLTIYDLIPPVYKDYNIAGRLDKDSSGLVILTNNGQLLHQLTHPSKNKQKVYHVQLDKQVSPKDFITITHNGVDIGDDRPSTMEIQPLSAKQPPYTYKVTLHEGRNRQIRRTFSALGYFVTALHRTNVGKYSIADVTKMGSYVLK